MKWQKKQFLKFGVSTLVFLGVFLISLLFYKEIAYVPPVVEIDQEIDIFKPSLDHYYIKYSEKKYLNANPRFDESGVPVIKMSDGQSPSVQASAPDRQVGSVVERRCPPWPGRRRHGCCPKPHRRSRAGFLLIFPELARRRRPSALLPSSGRTPWQSIWSIQAIFRNSSSADNAPGPCVRSHGEIGRRW